MSGRKRMRIVLTSEEERHVAIDGSVWYLLERSLLHNILQQEVGTTMYAKRHIMKGKARTAFSFIIDHCVMNRIRAFTIEEADCFSEEKLNMTYQIARKYIANSVSC
ncbi:hypothetical protein TNCT_393921 [Trichonephila clavata]|uniref:Uncharacterized protein n=1 Tax=Trichonephila clavata TaxID=2740835 RepID=A0A8X6G4N6_TRICU|nr:hypothetical protein TNCT_393921 [Trichonephila clavata]